MKKIALVALVATSAAVAAPFNGFSVGANLGGSFNKFTGENTTFGKKTNKKTSFIGSLFVGYTKSFNNIFAGLDLGLGFEGKSALKNTDAYSLTAAQAVQLGLANLAATASISSETTIKPGISFQIAPRLGYKFNDTTAAYFKLGMDFTKYEVQYKALSGTGTQAGASRALIATELNFFTSSKEKKSQFSVTPTLGFEKAFGAVSMRAELGYKVTSKKTYFNDLKIKRNAVIMTIGASYNF